MMGGRSAGVRPRSARQKTDRRGNPEKEDQRSSQGPGHGLSLRFTVLPFYRHIKHRITGSPHRSKNWISHRAFRAKKPSQVPKGASYITAARSLVVLSYPIRSFRRRRGGSKMRPEITPSSFFSPREYETTQAQSDDEESHVRTTHAYDHLTRHQARSPGQEGRGGSVRGGGDHTQLSHFPS